MAKKMHSALGCAFVVLAVVVFLPSAVAAESCAEDVRKFCADVPAGEGNIAKCLHQHREDLSAGCVEQMKADTKKLVEVSADCRNDVDRFCSDVEPGGGAIAACLLGHEQELDPACRKSIAEGRENVKKRVAGACAGDIEKLCKDVPAGGSRVQRCLEEHKGELSQGCVEQLKAGKEKMGKNRAAGGKG
jgi:hypothetical protein